MKAALASIMIVTACAAKAPSPPPEVIDVGAPSVEPPAVVVKPAPAVADVAKQYDDAAKQEVKAVTAPAVTPEYVGNVHAADHDAQEALRALERQKQHPTRTALERARMAVRSLWDALSATEQGATP